MLLVKNRHQNVTSPATRVLDSQMVLLTLLGIRMHIVCQTEPGHYVSRAAHDPLQPGDDMITHC